MTAIAAHPAKSEATRADQPPAVSGRLPLPGGGPPAGLADAPGRARPAGISQAQEQTSLSELVRTPELAAEVTLQPIQRFDFDAAILFSDILVIAEGLGQGYKFRDGGGIEMEFALRTADDIKQLDVPRAARTPRLHPARPATASKPALGDQTALIGFAGSPWTLANFMLEGGSADEFTQAKKLFYSEPEIFSMLMKKLTAAVTRPSADANPGRRGRGADFRQPRRVACPEMHLRRHRPAGSSKSFPR